MRNSLFLGLQRDQAGVAEDYKGVYAMWRLDVFWAPNVSESLARPRDLAGVLRMGEFSVKGRSD